MYSSRIGETICSLLLVGVLMVFAHGANAAERGGYLGFSLGTADDDILEETDTAYKLVGGFVANPNLGGEIAFVDLGSYVNDQLDQYGVSFQGVGYLPLGSNLDLFAKLGLFSWVVDVGGFTDDGMDLTYGFGAGVRMNSNLSVRAEWETFTDVFGGDVDLLSAGIVYHF